jgi:hypothetical protein
LLPPETWFCVWGGRCSWGFRLPFPRQLVRLGNFGHRHFLRQ